jgi:hypothetical protein
MNPLTPGILMIAPLTATGLLLLATHRTWQARRRWVEGVGTVLAAGALALLVSPLPALPRGSALPLLTLLATWLAHAHAAWRFEPDHGQRGVLWTFTATLRPTFASGLGIALAQALVHLAAPEQPMFLHTWLLIAGAITASSVQRELSALSLFKNSANHP